MGLIKVLTYVKLWNRLTLAFLLYRLVINFGVILLQHDYFGEPKSRVRIFVCKYLPNVTWSLAYPCGVENRWCPFHHVTWGQSHCGVPEPVQEILPKLRELKPLLIQTPWNLIHLLCPAVLNNVKRGTILPLSDVIILWPISVISWDLIVTIISLEAIDFKNKHVILPAKRSQKRLFEIKRILRTEVCKPVIWLVMDKHWSLNANNLSQ